MIQKTNKLDLRGRESLAASQFLTQKRWNLLWTKTNEDFSELRGNKAHRVKVLTA